jgi:hypothetical protein
MGGKKPKQPKAPDYKALAEQQAGLDKENALLKTKLDRADQVNPYGTLKWTQDPNDPNKWTQTETLNDDAMATLRAQQSSELALANAGQGMLSRATGAVDKPFTFDDKQGVRALDVGTAPTSDQFGDYREFDFSQLGDMPDAGFGAVQEVQDAMMGRMNPALEQGRNREINRLKAQGITEGTPAWQQAMRSLNERDVDANQQALLGATSAYGDIFDRGMSVRQQGMGEEMASTSLANALRGQRRSEGMEDYDTSVRNQLMQRAGDTEDRSRQVQEDLMLRQLPLNEFNAFMSGSQVSNPNFEGYAASTGSSAADIFGASKAQYDDAIGRYNAKLAGKGNKGGSALSGAASGAAAGSMFGPWGTAIGGLVGGAAGYLGG